MCQQSRHAGVSMERKTYPEGSQEIPLEARSKMGSFIKGSNVVMALRQRLPNLHRSVNLKDVNLGYHALIEHSVPVLVCLLVITFAEIGNLASVKKIMVQLWEYMEFNLLYAILCSVSAAFFIALYIRIYMRKPTYIVDFACYKPNPDRECSYELLEYFARRAGVYSEESIEFQKKVFVKSGLGNRTHLAPFAYHERQLDPSMEQARIESEEVMFAALDELFLITGVTPKEVGILIVNCSCFTPTPSLTSMIVNRFKMRSNICSFNLSGMGCSAGMIAIDLAKDILRTHANSYAIVLSTENITLNWYCGNKKSMLLSNCLFRVGGAAILLTNKRSERRRAKYELIHSVRTHRAPDDESFQSVIQQEDEDGVVGVSLSKHLMVVAGDALKANMTTLGPLVLPLSEQLRFLFNLISRKVFHSARKPYIPDFKLAFDHFLLHAGGRAVLDELQKNLKLSDFLMEPSRTTLHRFGNTSSSCLWYELAYVEAKERVKKGDRLWQVGIGSGFKCNSVVWKALRTAKQPSHSPWLESIHEYPANISKNIPDINPSGNLMFRTVDGKLFFCRKGCKSSDDEILAIAKDDPTEEQRSNNLKSS